MQSYLETEWRYGMRFEAQLLHKIPSLSDTADVKPELLPQEQTLQITMSTRIVNNCVRKLFSEPSWGLFND